MWDFSRRIYIKRIESNHIRAMMDTYGIEAGVATIIKELSGIFSHYGIQVDRRHLTLIADHMTFNGEYRPFHRNSMFENPSPLLRMSFERSTNYIMSSALYNESDSGRTPAGCIVMGRPAPAGTGSFELIEAI